MEQIQIKTPEDFAKLLDLRKEEAKEIASIEAIKISQEVIEREFDLLEFNIFISSFGKKLTRATQEIEKLRKRIDKKKIDLSEYENMADEFV